MKNNLTYIQAYLIETSLPSSYRCTLCNNEIIEFKYCAMQSWNLKGYLCGRCYSKKLDETYLSNKVDDKSKNVEINNKQ